MHKEIRNTLAYIVVATFVMITAVWQAQVSAKRDLEARHRALPPPSKTKRADRPVPQPFTGDVVADYVARCEKGMTDQEIGWILEDFKNAGLDILPAEGSPDTDLISFHKRQNRWYRDSLADGLRLSTAQSADVDRNLARHLQVVSDVAMHVATDEEIEEMSELADDQISLLFRRWFFSSVKDGRDIGIAPPGLFTPTPGQQDILDNSISKVQPDPFDNVPSISQPPPADSGRSTLKGKTAATYPIDEDYPIPAGFGAADRSFPILKSQQTIASRRTDPDTAVRFIHNVRHLHPAQLKVLLLAEPEMAKKIQAALEAQTN